MSAVYPSSPESRAAGSPSPDHRKFIGGAWITGLGTLASRVLGLVRDMVTAALLGLGESGVMDALVIAVRVPNLFRRLFGEGALTASFMPVFAAERERSIDDGWKLASAVLVWLTAVLAALVLAVEVLLGVAWLFWRQNEAVSLLIGLVAANLPYVVTICVASLFAAILQATGRFSVAAWSPALLNVCWIGAAWWIAPRMTNDHVTQAWIIVGSIQLAGVLQALVQFPSLRAAGFRFRYDWRASKTAVMKVGRAIALVSFGLMITQINTLLDSFVAWALAASPQGSTTAAWLGGVAYPMKAGAASAIYYGERFYQLPLGLLGFAIATAIFPLLSRHAAKGDHRQLGIDLTLALRVALFTGVPAGVGLVLLADPIAQLVYRHGSFSADDATRTARMIAMYSTAVWAYCAAPVLTRGFYAHGNQLTPMRVGLLAVALNVVLDFTLVWPLAEVGLALSTAVAAVFQLAMLAAAFQLKYRSLEWRAMAKSLGQIIIATLAMIVAVLATTHWQPQSAGWFSRALALFTAIVAGAASYGIVAWLLGAAELPLLFHRNRSVNEQQTP